MYDGMKEVHLEKLNVENVAKNVSLFNSFNEWQQTSLPRTRAPIFVPPKKKKNKVKWTFPKSVFTKWIPDDSEIITLCFEYDWECSKITKIVKDPEQLV